MINLGNILVSAYFLLVFLSTKLAVNYHITKDKEYDFCELAELEGCKDKEETFPAILSTTLQGYESRVAALVIQYLWIIRLFAISLVFVYLTIIFTPIPTNPNERFISKFAIATNIFNFLEGIIVFLAFRVLYSETLNKQDKDNRFWVIPSVLACIYIAVFIYLSWGFDLNKPHSQFLNIFDLISGSVNGLAMFLLFGRYVSLEQSLRDTELFKEAFRDLFKPLPLETERSYTNAVSFAIIFLLPIYALAQPLFGSLNISLYGKDPTVFQTTVYGICLVGKICFFHLTYLLLSKKLLHLYLYGLVSKVGNFRKLEQCLAATPATTINRI